MSSKRVFILFKIFYSITGMFLLFALSPNLNAEESGVTIRGDQESPNVLYLVPWKRTPSSQGNTDFELELDYDLIPLSRSETIRQVRYFKQLGYDKNVTVTQKKDLQP